MLITYERWHNDNITLYCKNLIKKQSRVKQLQLLWTYNLEKEEKNGKTLIYTAYTTLLYIYIYIYMYMYVYIYVYIN